LAQRAFALGWEVESKDVLLEIGKGVNLLPGSLSKEIYKCHGISLPQMVDQLLLWMSKKSISLTPN